MPSVEPEQTQSSPPVTRDALDAALARLELRMTLRLGGLVALAAGILGLLIKL